MSGLKIQKGTVGYLSKKIQFEIENDGPLKDSRWLKALVIAYIDFCIFRPLIQHIPPEYKETMIALARGADIDLKDIQRAAAMPDAMVILAYRGLGKYYLSHIAPHLFGCTSFVAFDDMTLDGQLCHGRNLDFPVLNSWDKFSTVIYQYPTDAQMYVSITTAGVHVPGVTAYNESGLILGIHQLFTTDASVRGVPIVIICGEIIKNATSIDEAIQIVRRMKRAGNWAIVLSSHREKRAVVIETSPKEVYVRESKDHLIAHSNYCFSPHLKKHEIFFNLTTAEDNFYRHQRLRSLCLSQKGRLDEKMGVSILGDHVDPVTQKTKSIGRTVSAIYNVQSAFFQPESKRFFLSTGLAPANLSEYVELPWDAEREPINEEQLLPPNEFSLTNHAKAMREYASAYHHFSNTKDITRTCDHIRKAMAHDPNEFAYPLALGVMLIKKWAFSDAQAILKETQGLASTLQEAALTALLLGRTYDLMGKRQLAKNEYKPYVTNINLDLKLRRAFKRLWQRPYNRKAIKKSIFQFIFTDFLAY